MDLAAKMQTVETLWDVRNTRRLVIGPEPKLVLAIRANRDAELRQVFIAYPRLGDADNAGAIAESLILQVPHAAGQRQLRPQGEPYVIGQENINATAMFGEDPEDQARLPEHIRWHGGVVPLLEYNRNVAPAIWWAWQGRILVPQGLSVGLIVQCNQSANCFALMKGI